MRSIALKHFISHKTTRTKDVRGCPQWAKYEILRKTFRTPFVGINISKYKHDLAILDEHEGCESFTPS